MRICSFPRENELGRTLSDDISSRLTNIDSRILLFRATNTYLIVCAVAFTFGLVGHRQRQTIHFGLLIWRRAVIRYFRHGQSTRQSLALIVFDIHLKHTYYRRHQQPLFAGVQCRGSHRLHLHRRRLCSQRSHILSFRQWQRLSN